MFSFKLGVRLVIISLETFPEKNSENATAHKHVFEGLSRSIDPKMCQLLRFFFTIPMYNNYGVYLLVSGF